MSDEKSVDPSTQLLPPGWRKIYVQRMGGKTAGKYDAYIYSPDGRKHRSKTDIIAYLTKRGIVDQYDTDVFDFTVRNVSVAESADSLNCGTSDPLQSKEKKSYGNSCSKKVGVQKRSRKHKAEVSSEMPNRTKKIKHSGLENIDNVDVSDNSEKKVKNFKKLSASSSVRLEKLSASNFRKSKISSPAKKLKRSSFKMLKVKLNFSPRMKKEADFTDNTSAELTAKELPDDDGLDAGSSESLEERLDDVSCPLEDSAEEKPLDSFVSNASCASPELFSDVEECRIPNDCSVLEYDDQKSDHLDSLDIDTNFDVRVDHVSGTKTFSDSEVAPDHESFGLSEPKKIPSILEEHSDNASLHLDTDSKSDLFCAKVKTKADKFHGKIDNKKPFAVNRNVTADQGIHSSGNRLKTEKWIPPQSPYNLIEESLGGNPWKVLVTSVFVDSKEGCSAESGLPKRTVRQFFKLCPTPESLQSFSTKRICKFLKQVLISEETVITIKKFSEEYLTANWQDPTTLYGITNYGKDSYRMFCINEWKQIAPEHPKLKMYHKWLWENHRTLRID